MGIRRFAWGTTLSIVGLIFLVNQVYVDTLGRIGIGVYFDWLGATHVLPFGVYYVGVGGMYLFVGGLSFWIASGRELAFQHLVLGVVVSLTVVWIGLLAVVMGPIETVSLRRFATTLAIGPVLIGLLIGAAPNQSTSRMMWLVAVVLFVPFFVLQVMTAQEYGGLGDWGTIDYIIMVSLAVLNTIWGYPLYRLGRTFEGTTGSKSTDKGGYIRRVTRR